MQETTRLNEPISLKTAILTFKDYFFELLRKSYWYFIVGILFLLPAHYYYKKQVITYVADAAFMTNNDSGGSMSGLLQLAGQFGFGGKGGKLGSDMLTELVKSRRMVYQTLMRKVDIDGKEDLLFNHYINLFDLAENTPEKVLAESFYFKRKKIRNFSKEESIVAKNIYDGIIQTLNVFSQKSGIIYCSFETIDKDFTKAFLEELLKNLADYYTNKSVEQQKDNFELLDSRVDSLERALYNTENALATWIETHRSGLRASTLSAHKIMEQERLKTKAEVLSVMYTEVVKNRELAHMQLLSMTPLIQVIDYPTYPLTEKMPSRKAYYGIALVLTLGLVTVLVLFNKLVRDALRE